MTIKGFDHLNLTVSDFDETVDWYHRVFGFRIVEEDVTDGVRWGILRSGDQMLCIYEHNRREFWDRHELKRKGIHGISHFGFRIEDEKEWLATLQREDITPVTWDYPHSKSWYVADPTGYEIEVALWKNGVRFGHETRRVTSGA